uniref:Uncharacterized protein n=1 Tax=Chenopodium quinoa TaxID=63459 RepID=A0A803MVF9_CHEQI
MPPCLFPLLNFSSSSLPHAKSVITIVITQSLSSLLHPPPTTPPFASTQSAVVVAPLSSLLHAWCHSVTVVACGKRAGAYTCLLDETGRYDSPEFASVDHKPDFKVSSLTEVQSLLETHFDLRP